MRKRAEQSGERWMLGTRKPWSGFTISVGASSSVMAQRRAVLPILTRAEEGAVEIDPDPS